MSLLPSVVSLVQDQAKELLQQQLKLEEGQKDEVANHITRVQTLSVNINYWRKQARDFHECATCKRKLNAAEMATFMKSQVSSP